MQTTLQCSTRPWLPWGNRKATCRYPLCRAPGLTTCEPSAHPAGLATCEPSCTWKPRRHKAVGVGNSDSGSEGAPGMDPKHRTTISVMPVLPGFTEQQRLPVILVKETRYSVPQCSWATNLHFVTPSNTLQSEGVSVSCSVLLTATEVGEKFYKCRTFISSPPHLCQCNSFRIWPLCHHSCQIIQLGSAWRLAMAAAA